MDVCGHYLYKERERWKEVPSDSELSRVLMEHLVNKAASPMNAALPTLVVSIIATSCTSSLPLWL